MPASTSRKPAATITMKTLVLASHAHDLRAAIDAVSDRVRALVLVDGADATAAGATVRERGGEVIDVAEVANDRRRSFRDRYVAFMAGVNEANRSRFWWAMPFTTKNPLATPLCRDVFSFLVATDLVASGDTPVAVVTDSEALGAQLAAWAGAHGVRVIGRVRRRGPAWRRAVRRALPALFLLGVATLVRTWWRARGLRPASSSPAIALTTLVHGHSLPGGGRYREAYFGTLPEYLASRGREAFLFGLMIERPEERLIEAASRATMPLPLVPVEAALSLRDLVACVVHAAARYLSPFRITGVTEIDGRDVRPLLEDAVRRACRDGGFLTHLRLYYAGRALVRRVPVERVIYPYENRAFEKMLLTGVREGQASTRLVGYNHASITASHLNFMLGVGEAKTMPLPDVLLTLGPVVTEWLECDGQYPPGLLKSACALRQAGTLARPARAGRRPLRDVLVCLATSLREYARTLRLLEAAWHGGTPYRLRVRPHPTLRLADGVAAAGLGDRAFFEVDESPLDESLSRADVVLYASSTVGLEAVAIGIPAVYLDLRDMLDTDPMPGWSELKWTVSRADQLMPTLREIDALGDAELAERRARAAHYAERYLGRVDERALAAFVEA
jgi:hypothetical protein